MRYWIGVVGTNESKDRLVAKVDTWWCVSEKAAAGDLIAMYMTRAVSEKGSGIFAIFRITAIDAKRKDECRGFGSMVGGTFHFFALISPISRVTVPVALDAFRKDATLYRTPFVRRNAQGTLFELSEREFRRLEFLCFRAKADDKAATHTADGSVKKRNSSHAARKVKSPMPPTKVRTVKKTVKTSTLPKIKPKSKITTRTAVSAKSKRS